MNHAAAAAANNNNDEQEEGDDELDEHPALRAYENDEPLHAILSIIDGDPGLIRFWDEGGWSFLHQLVHADARPTLPGVVRHVLTAWPGSIREWTRSVSIRSLPLHLACRYGSERGGSDDDDENEEEEYRFMAIRIMVEAWPESVQQRNSKGEYPLELHIGSPTLNVIRCFVTAWPEAIEQAYRNGTLLLHEATCVVFSEAETLRVVRYVLEQRPESIRDLDKHGRLALHIATGEPSVDVVRCLVDAGEESMKVRCRDHMLPIHAAVIYCSHSVEYPSVRFLAQRWPQSLRKELHNRWLPLHLALWHWPSEPWVLEAVRFLVEQYPESVREATDEGFLPLHIAAGRDVQLTRHSSDVNESAQMELALVRYLYELAPTSVRAAARDGSLPLHCAARTGYSIPAAQFLVDKYREAIHVGNNEGITPLLTALARNLDNTELGFEVPHRFFEPRSSDPSTELVRLLLDRRLVCEESDRRVPPPLHFAIAHGQPLEVLRCLVEHHPACLLRQNEQGSFAIHAAVACDPPRLDLVRLIVSKRPESVKVVDKRGSTPLHLAVSRSQPSMDLVKFLVAQPFPTAQARDGRGLLPLQVAAVADAPLELLHWLALAWPEAVYRGSPSPAPTRNQHDRPTRPKRPSRPKRQKCG